MIIEKIDEFEITEHKSAAISQLLQQSFDLFPNDRIYYNQVPNFRLLVWEGEQLIAQVGLVYRIVALDNQPIRIFGIMDLCVDNNFRNQQIGTKLLTKIDDLAKANSIDFILLFGSGQDFYLNHNYQLANNPCRWVLLKNHRTMGILQRTIPETILVKQIGKTAWKNEATLDLMGFVF
jgi:predicted N-acetyltransferase YhbS